MTRKREKARCYVGANAGPGRRGVGSVANRPPSRCAACGRPRPCPWHDRKFLDAKKSGGKQANG